MTRRREGGGADRRAVTGGRPDNAALALGTKTGDRRRAWSTHHVAVVEQPVKSGGCDDRIGKHRAPFGDRYRRLAVADPNKA